MATQECFDQNVLKISPISNFMDNPHDLANPPIKFYGNNYQSFKSNVQPLNPNLPLIIDDYTIRDPIVANPKVLVEQIIFNITVRYKKYF